MYIKAGYKLNLTAAAAWTILQPDENSAWTLGEAKFGEQDGKAVYEISLDKNISAGEFVAKVGLDAMTHISNGSITDLDVTGTAADDKITLTKGQTLTFQIKVNGNVGAKKASDVNISWDTISTTSDFKKLGIAVTVEERAQDNAPDVIDVTLTNNGDTAVELSTAAQSADSGTLKVDVSGLAFNLVVKAKAATPTN